MSQTVRGIQSGASRRTGRDSTRFVQVLKMSVRSDENKRCAMLAPFRGKHANRQTARQQPSPPASRNLPKNGGGPTTWWSGRAATGSHTFRNQRPKTGRNPEKFRPQTGLRRNTKSGVGRHPLPRRAGIGPVASRDSGRPLTLQMLIPELPAPELHSVTAADCQTLSRRIGSIPTNCLIGIRGTVPPAKPRNHGD